MNPNLGRQRVVVENVRPQVDAGRFAVKRALGDRIVVEADSFADGHDIMRCNFLLRHESQPQWTESPMQPQGNDLWRSEFLADQLGRYEYSVEAWIDHFHTWRYGLRKKHEAGQDVSVELLIGAELVSAAHRRVTQIGKRNLFAEDAKYLAAAAKQLEEPGKQPADAIQLALSDELLARMDRFPDRQFATRHPTLAITVDPLRARFSAWYEFFPRSTATRRGEHGTFKDCLSRLDYVQQLGFDVVYLPPIHPVGEAFRKGKNNATSARTDDVGSPWAIGGVAGGHREILPELGTLADFRSLVEAARTRDISLGIDIAFQCSPDHPYVKQHPNWFRARPDGSIQYAENPPKKYQDIFPFDFETDDWQALWNELTEVVLFWARQGVRVFRVDNPHTKPFDFWEFLIGNVKRNFPETIFLSEAFTRPKIMYRLGKLGFTQSYSYFTWRTLKAEFIEYFTELTQTPVRETFRPNLWPNTPDILPEYLHSGSPPVFSMRLLLAATLGANYGIYGPAYELCEHLPREHKSEEYLDSEKYQLRHWDLNSPRSIAPLITKVNQIRRQQPALQNDWNLDFHPTDNDQLLCYSKSTDDKSNIVVMVVNLDGHQEQHGFITLPLDQWGIDHSRPFEIEDLLTGAHYQWQGPREYVELHPDQQPGHIFRIRG